MDTRISTFHQSQLSNLDTLQHKLTEYHTSNHQHFINLKASLSELTSSTERGLSSLCVEATDKIQSECATTLDNLAQNENTFSQEYLTQNQATLQRQGEVYESS